MKKIVEIEWHGLNTVLDVGGIEAALYQHFRSHSFTVRELPVQPERGKDGKTCSNCGNNRGTTSMPCLICGGVVTPCDYSHWQPIPGKVDDKMEGKENDYPPVVETVVQSPMNGTAFEMHEATGNPVGENIKPPFDFMGDLGFAVSLPASPITPCPSCNAIERRAKGEG